MRLLLTSLPLALRSILQWPMRAALTAFGILIGVAAVVITVALGEGTEIAVRQKLNNLGENTLTVAPEQARASGATEQLLVPRLTEGDGEALAREASDVASVAPLLTAQADVAFGGFKVSSQVTGTRRSFFEIRDWQVDKGELWSEQAESTASRVCLIGAKLAAELFGNGDPVGRVLRIGRHPFRVLGVLREKGQGAFGQDQDTIVLMPIATHRSKLKPTSPGLVDQILVKAKSERTVDAARRDATAILRQRHGLAEGVDDDFNIRSQDAFRETQARIVGVLRLLLTSIAAISLLVGGIGIMNIMLVSVTERTRDIGIRMAIGATRWDILVQFLTESVLLSLLGGALGTALSVAGTLGLAHALSLPMRPSAEALLLALGVSTGIGVVFGLVPSWRAASLDPIIALGRQ
jgi:putative ABC transport system permease protein